MINLETKVTKEKEPFELLTNSEIKNIHKKEQIRMKKPSNIAFKPGDYVSIKNNIVYNHECPEFNFNNLYGFVSYDEVTNNEGYIKIVRFREEDKK